MKNAFIFAGRNRNLFMLSLSCQTAIKAAIYLASRLETGQKSGIKEIAGYIHASEHTVGKVLQALVKQNVVCSTKGPSGGFYVTQKQYGQPIIRIIEAVDGTEVFKTCGLGLSKCSSSNPCPIHNGFKVIREAYERIYTDNTLADLCEPVSTGVTHLAIQSKQMKAKRSGVKK